MIDFPIDNKAIQVPGILQWLNAKDQCTHKIHSLYKLTEGAEWKLIKQETLMPGEVYYPRKLSFGGCYKRIMRYYAETWQISSERDVTVKNGFETMDHPKIWTGHFADVSLAVEFKLACL